MNTTSFLLSGIVGTIVYFLLGWLFYGILFTNIYPNEQSMLFIFLGCLCYAFTFALIFNRWAHISTFGAGITAGFFIGLLWALSMSFFMRASTSGIDTTFALQVAIDAVSAAIMGGVMTIAIRKTKA